MPPCGSILVSDNKVFAFWVVAYVRFNCIKLYIQFFKTKITPNLNISARMS